MNVREIETRLAYRFNYTRNFILPNYYIDYDFEIDIAVLTKSGYLYEIEIKTSVQDVKKDLQKEHKHNDRFKKINKHFMAMPKDIYEKAKEFIPNHFGIFLIYSYGMSLVKKAKVCNRYKFSLEEQVKFLRLCQLRMWRLKIKQNKGT